MSGDASTTRCTSASTSASELSADETLIHHQGLDTRMRSAEAEVHPFGLRIDLLAMDCCLDPPFLQLHPSLDISGSPSPQRPCVEDKSWSVFEIGTPSIGNSQGGDDSQTFEQDEKLERTAIRPASPSLDEPTAAFEFKIKPFDHGHRPVQGFITLDTNDGVARSVDRV